MAMAVLPNPQASTPLGKLLPLGADACGAPLDLARLAAYIDGEGYIRIFGAGREHTDHIGLFVANTDYKLHTWLKSTFGGSIQVMRGRSARYKKCWKWYAASKLSYVLLKACIPYFIMKRDQAEFAIELHELVQAQVGVRTSGAKKNQYAVVGKDDLEKRRRFGEQLRFIRSNQADRMAS